MNYLLDTHVFLWMLSDPGRLNRKAVRAIHVFITHDAKMERYAGVKLLMT